MKADRKAYNSERRKDPAYVARQRDWAKAWQAAHKDDPVRKAAAAERMRGYAKQPEVRQRHEARWILNRAIAIGRVVPLPCFVCGADAQAHHVAYDLPLDVAWLCREHHRQVHAEAKAAP